MAIDKLVLIEAVAEELGRRMKARAEGETIPAGVSARHVHLCAADFAVLYGPGAALTPSKPLSQPGQFAAEEKVTLVGPGLRAIEGVRILGPLRARTQVELSATDARVLGVDPPLRESGDVAGSAPVSIVGPAGALRVREGCIVALRHIHFSTAEAERFGVRDKDVVDVSVDTPRGGTLAGVVCRVSDSFALDFHVDTDEANAFGIRQGQQVRISGRGGRA